MIKGKTIFFFGAVLLPESTLLKDKEYKTDFKNLETEGKESQMELFQLNIRKQF